MIGKSILKKQQETTVENAQESIEETEQVLEAKEEVAQPEPQVEAPAVSMTQVVTGTAPAFKLPTGEAVQLEEYLIWLGNQVWAIKESVA